MSDTVLVVCFGKNTIYRSALGGATTFCGTKAAYPQNLLFVAETTQHIVLNALASLEAGKKGLSEGFAPRWVFYPIKNAYCH